MATTNYHNGSQNISENAHPLILLVRSLASRTLESGIVKLPITPFVNARWILQAQSADPRVRKGQVNRCENTAQVLMKIRNDQGLTSLWRGLSVDILKSGVQFFLSPFLFALRGIFPRYNPNKDFVKFYLSSLGGGYVIGVCMQFCLRPLDYCRAKLALDCIGQREFNGALDVIMKTAKGPNGFTAIYSGFSASLLKALVYRISYFTVFDILRAVNPYSGRLVARFLNAQVVSLVGLALCYPFETVERKMQAQADKDKKEWVYQGTIDCFKKTWQEEGIAGFYHGIRNNISTMMATTFLLFVSDMLFKSK